MLSTRPCSRTEHHQRSGSAVYRQRRAVEIDAAADDFRRRFAAGDRDAFRVLYARYAGPMLTAALHTLGGNRRLAEEAVQIAMVKAWRAAASYDPARPLAPWLYAIARRSAIDIGRQEQHHRLLSSDPPVGQSAAGVGDEYESATAARAVREALDALPVREYKVMRLSYFEGLTQVEIAERLAIPVGTVKSRAASAHRRLRDQLGRTAPKGSLTF